MTASAERIVLAGTGAQPVGEHWELSLRSLGARAVREALAQSGGLRPQALYLGNSFASVLSHQANLGTLICEQAGFSGIEAVSFEAAGASSGEALLAAIRAVKSGYVDTAVAMGVEKVTETVGSRVADVQNMTLNYEYEAMAGLTLPAGAALLARRYLEEFGLEREVLDCISLPAYAQACGNPKALYHLNLTPEKIQRQTLTNDPLGLYDCSTLADGAAAVVVTRESLFPAELQPVYVLGSGCAIGPLSLHDRPNLLHYSAAEWSAVKAFNQAGVSTDQIDLWEIWDAFSIDAILSRESIGLAEPGQGWRADGRYYAGMGGCLGRGNPLGASAMYQIVEAVQQLRSQAGACQIAQVQTVFVQSLGALGATAVSHILSVE